MRYTVRKSLIWVVGRIWMPSAVYSQVITLSGYDIENMRDGRARMPERRTHRTR